jgi:hypothetical protein
LKQNSETERLSFAIRDLVEIYFTFESIVVSSGFGGISHFCVRRDLLEGMCTNLTKMHSILFGKTALEDNDSNAFVEFEIESNGKVKVSGQVGGTHEDHFVKFKFHSDQSCLESLTEDFNSLLNHR